MKNIRKQTLGFINSMAMPELGTGNYRYSLISNKATLYSSTYAAMTRSLYHDLNSTEECRQWAKLLNSYQDDDGLFRDPVMFDQGWYAGDPLTCGRPHLTCHVIEALTCLGGVAAKENIFLEPWLDADFMRNWLNESDWGERVAWTGNEIMNIGTLLQYERDFHNNEPAGKAIQVLLEWLSTRHINPVSGIWGDLDIADPINRSHAVQAAYHWWPLFFYDQHPIPYIEEAIDTVLATQNRSGGFGCGVHNPDAPDKSSACEDIDSIDPLCRMLQLTEYRRDEIVVSLEKAIPWVIKNQMLDGGFVFILDRDFEYGHEEFKGKKDAGAMFPTWFRTLSLSLIGKALPDSFLGKYNWQFVNSPGMQFWRRTLTEKIDK